MMRPLRSPLIVALVMLAPASCVESDPKGRGLDLPVTPLPQGPGFDAQAPSCNGVVCAAADACHVGTCDPATGQCKQAPLADGTSCDDGNACTKGDTCQSGKCAAGTQATCTASDACHSAGTCDPKTGACSNPPVADGASCDDGDLCTKASQCVAGTCVGSDPVVCAAADQCHSAGTCDPKTGCSDPPLADDTACDDGIGGVTSACVAGTCTSRPTTCRQKQLVLGASVPDGVYTLYSPSGPVQAYCDMTTDGGGWTALFSGTNGSTHVFDHFDVTSYAGTFNDPTAANYLRRAPAELGNAAAELAVTCGTAKVKFAVTEPVRKWLFSGTQSDWQPLTPTVLAGTVTNVPNGVYTGNGANQSFIFAKDRNPSGNTFASSYNNGAQFNYCNGSPDTTSPVRLLYRELPSPPIKNSPTPARASCLAIRDASEANGDGLYWIKPEATSYLAYCDMTSGGGGWTATYAARNGSPNVFGHFDTGAYSELCTDPATRCLRRPPAAVGDSHTEVAVSCGASMVRFTMTEQVRKWLGAGVQQDWIALTPNVVSGSVLNVPNSVWTGTNVSNLGFVFAKNQLALGNTFASAYLNNADFDYCAGTPDQASIVRVYYREASATAIRNTAATADLSCRALLDGGATQSGLYHLTDGKGGTYLAYCDMAMDGGGWTATFTGRNGSVNVFDHFDVGSYQGTCTDPATRCLRRTPAFVGESATDIAVSCGTSTVKFPLTEQVRRWMGFGQQLDWVPITATVVSGTVVNVPDSLWTGANVSNRGFVVAKSKLALGNTFASAYLNNKDFDYCSNAPDQASPLRVSYREAKPTPVLNTAATAGTTCRALQLAGASTSGIYHLIDGAGTILAYCDMTTDGGGWTTLYAGRNGSVNVFDYFDAGAFQGTCTDPATRCVHRAPAALGTSAADMLVSCGNSKVRFARTEQVSKWLATGLQQDWINLTPTVVAGSIGAVPDTLFTGASISNRGFIVAKGKLALGNTFASAYLNDASYDYCGNAPDQASPVRLAVRELAPEAPRNTPAQAKASCLALLGDGFTTSGLYWLTESGGTPYTAYCDMTSAGGGWTAIFAGRNGVPNVFGQFDVGVAEVCTDPATRCVRRAPASSSTATELAAACGAAMVRFPMTAAARAYFTAGTQADWVSLTPTVVSGSFVNVPNALWTGASASNRGFIFAKNNLALGNTFASTYANNATFDYCANVPDAASMVRVFYR